MAAPGSTVVVAPSPAAAPAKKAATPPNTFTENDKLSIILELVQTANGVAPGGKKVPVLARAGAIDALGSIGGDATAMHDVVSGLMSVLDQEFIRNGMSFKDPAESPFLCYHTVKALANLGWGAKPALAKLQLLRGQDVILDSAIDYAVGAIRTGPVPAKPKAAGGDGDN